MDQILGQSRALEVLQAALQSGRSPHAYIFHGPEGVGKFTTALAFAQVLLCHQPQRDLRGWVTACRECKSCRLLRSGQAHHPDLHVITKELARFSEDRATRQRKLQVIPVEVLRAELLGPVYLASSLGHPKVFIVDEAELLNIEGQNLLLKTLEEPPAGTYLILVTSSEDDLLPTVLSRCQRVAFAPLPERMVEQWLIRQEVSLAAEPRAWLLEFAAGSPGRAALALQYDLWSWARVLLPALEGMGCGRYPLELGEQMSQMIDQFATRWVKEHANASKEAANRDAAALLWTILAQQARKRLLELSERCPAEDPEAAEALLQPWLGVIDALQQTEGELASNVNLGLVTEQLACLMHRSLNGSAAA